MKCPNCKQPLAGGLFMCPKCEGQAGGELMLLASLDQMVGYEGLPAPVKFEWRKNGLVVVYREADWLGSRELFNHLYKQGVSTNARDPKQAVYTVKFHDLGRLKEALRSFGEPPF